jgi:AraC-like DNA-binding protein
MSAIEFCESDRAELMTVLRELYNISGFRISVHDNEYREIAAYPQHLSPFCELVQSGCGGNSVCLRNDIDAFKTAKETGSVYIYRCCYGLYEAVAPVYCLGMLSGYLMMGQVLCDDETPAGLERTAREFTDDEQKIRGILGAVTSCRRDRIESCVKIMEICAKYITMSNRFFLRRDDLAGTIKQYIDDNYMRSISLASICESFFYSRTTLINVFKSRYGLSINDYLNRVRTEKAAERLKVTNSSIKEIAASCGFRDQNYFSKVFFKYFGVTPTEYRRGACRNIEKGK